MNIKLNTITKQYRKFLDEQVLTEGQLNEFIEYFDTQDRLTRTQLTGTGILCGLKPTLVESSANSPLPYIKISQGIGITTDGDLFSLQEPIEKEDVFDVEEVTISLNEQLFTHYKTFNDELNYFEGINGEFLELAYDLTDVDPSEYDTFSNIFDFDDKVVILYLESFSDVEDLCEGVNCDTQGIPQIANLKVLLVDLDVARSIVQSDSLFTKYEGFKTLHDELPSLEVRRMVFMENDVQEPSNFKTLYNKVITEAPLITEELATAFGKIAAEFDIDLGFSGALITKINSVINFNGADFQYKYSLLKDLVDTYNEIRGSILKLHSECLMDITAFPKHLMLGIPLEESTTIISDLLQETAYRHEFYKASPLSYEDQYYERVVFLANRFVKLLNSYNYVSTGGIMITPSNRNLVLGSKAIPFYYNINDDFLLNWNFDNTKNKRHAYQLSYHRSKLSSAIEVQQPFSFQIDNYDFYRIEGHIGMDYQDVYHTVKNLRAEYGLAFNIRMVRLEGEDELEPDDDKVPTELLSEYMERNSGLIHRGGVQQGGTMVFVMQAERYSGDNSKKDTHKVVADFSLPYACCETKEQVLVSISTSEICQNDESIPISIVPLNGELKAWIKTDDKSAFLEPTGTEYRFHPSRVTGGDLEQTITFTVNDQRVPNTLIVHEISQIKVTSGAPIYDDNSEKATIVFKVNETAGGNLQDYEYVWDWGDREITYQKPDANGEVIHTYDVEANEEEQFFPRVLVSNDSGCAVNIDIELAPLELVLNKDTKIKIYFDNSGSMNETLYPLQKMRDDMLKDKLIKFYGTEELYKQQVTIENFEIYPNEERTFHQLNMLGKTPEGDGNVIVMVFQDEAASNYHDKSSVPSVLKPKYREDITNFINNVKTNFGTNNPNYYRGFIFQVETLVGNNVEDARTFKDFLQEVEKPDKLSPYSGDMGLSGTDKVTIKYGVKAGLAGENVNITQEYYFNLIVDVLTEEGFKLD